MDIKQPEETKPSDEDRSKELAKDIGKRLKLLENDRLPWENMWDNIVDYLIPQLGEVRNRSTEQADKKRGQKIYDGTAVTALELLSDGLHGYLVSPSMQWFRLRMAQFQLENMPSVKEWLQEAEQAIYASIQRSNFYEAMAQYFLDGGSIGTATMYIEEDIENDRIVFSTRHPKECFIAEDKFGNVDTLFRKFKMTAKQAKERFGDNVPNVVKQALENSPYEKFEFIHACYPRSDYNPLKRDAKNKKWASIYLFAPDDKILSESGYDRFPYAVWRWRKMSHETYGRSPGSSALVDIMALNQMSKTLLGAGQRAVDPPLNVPAEQKGKVRLVPHGINYYEETGRTISPIEQRMNYPIGADREEKKQQAIRDHFKVEFFLLLAQESKQMTATEIIERAGEKAAVLGTTIGRLNSECLNPLIDRVFDIELNKINSSIPPIPDELLEFGGENIEVDYLGPLAQAQKKLFKTQGVIASLERVVPFAQISPEILDNIDFDIVAKEIFDSYGMPQKAIRSEEVVQAIRQQKQIAQQQALAAEQMNQVPEQLKSLAEADQKSGGKVTELFEEEEA